MYRQISKIYPEGIRKRFKVLISYCDITMNYETYTGMALFFSFVLAMPAALFARLMLAYPPFASLALFVVLFLAIQALSYIFLVLRADAKGKFIEDILPDALLIMSMNIKSGMTTDRALIMAARPEFGPLEKELTKAGKEIFAGNDIKTALMSMTYRIRSSLFDRTIRLIIEGIQTGGELSTLLQQTAEDIQNTKLVQNEVRSNVMMYAIFIFFATGFGAPLLFGISTYLVGTIGAQFATFQAQGLSEDSVTISLQVSQQFLVNFAVIALCVISFFGGLIMGIVKGGTEKAGIKFIPMLMIMSLFIFFAVRAGVASIFPAIA